MYVTRPPASETQGPYPRPPEPPAPPIVGHALSYARNPLEYVHRTISEHGPVVSFRMPGQEGVLLAHPDSIEHVLARNADNYRKGDFQQKELSGLLGDGLLISEGHQWKLARSAIQPAFYPEQIATYASTMVECAEQQRAQWEEGQSIDISEVTSDIALAILGEVLFDTDFREAAAIREAARAVTDRFAPDTTLPFHVPDWIPLPRNRRYLRAVERLDSFVEDLIEARRSTPEGRDDLLSTMLNAGMGDQEVRDHLVTFLLAGHETTALTLTYTLYCLATHPEEQAVVADEVTSLDGRPGMNDSLPLTDRAIQEAVRLYPPVHLVMREAVDDDVVAGYRVPAGSLVICSQWATHRRAELYDDPKAYRPGRREKRDPSGYAYFPFGGGPRSCIGRRFALLEARLVLATLLQSFQFRAVTTNLDLTASMTLAPSSPVTLDLVERADGAIP